MSDTTSPPSDSIAADVLRNLRANVGRMKTQRQAYSSATVNMVDDAADTIEDLLTRVATLERQRNQARTRARSIEVLEWEQAGPPENPALQLHSQVTICGVPMHLEAHAVVTRDGVQESADPVDVGTQAIIDALFLIAGTDDPLHTVVLDPIGGPEYVLVAVPRAR